MTGRGVVTAAPLPRIEQAAWQLAAGRIGVHHLPDELAVFYEVAYQQGYHSRDDEVAQAKWEASRQWLIAMNPRDRHEYLLDRLEQAAVLADRPDVDDVLDETWRIYCQSLDNLREPVRLRGTTSHGRSAA